MAELRLHIAIEVVGRLRLVQETRSLLSEELSLVAFLLDQIFLLKELVQQQGGMIPPSWRSFWAEPDHPSLGHGLLRVLGGIQGQVRQLRHWGG
jgi:hypothetical protein